MYIASWDNVVEKLRNTLEAKSLPLPYCIVDTMVEGLGFMFLEEPQFMRLSPYSKC